MRYMVVLLFLSSCISKEEHDRQVAELRAQIERAEAQSAETQKRATEASKAQGETERRLAECQKAAEATRVHPEADALLAKLGDVVSGKSKLDSPVPVSAGEPFNIYMLDAIDSIAIAYQRDKKDKSAWKFFLEPKGQFTPQRVGSVITLCEPGVLANLTVYKITSGPLADSYMAIQPGGQLGQLVTIATRPFINKHLNVWNACLSIEW